MSHEQSETVQRADGKWINVYGAATAKAGQQLPGTEAYQDAESAVNAARLRSENYGRANQKEKGVRVNDTLQNAGGAKASDLAGNYLPATNTAEVHQEFQKDQIDAEVNGTARQTWPEWVASKGWRLTPNGQVLKPQ